MPRSAPTCLGVEQGGVRPGGQDGRGRIAAAQARRRRRHTTTPASSPMAASAPPPSADSRQSHSPDLVAAPRHAAPRRRGERRRVAPAHALEGGPARARLLERQPCAARAPAPGEAHPARQVRGDHHQPRADHAPVPARLVIGIGERAVAHPGAEVGRVRAVGEVGHRRVAAGAHLRPAAALAAAVLRVDGLDRLLAAVDPHLHELPVARVAPGPQHPAVLPVGLVPAPVLQPAPARRRRHRAAVRGRRRVGDARHRVALPGVVDVDRPEAIEQRGVVGPRDRRAQQAQRERRYKCARSFQVVSDQPGSGIPSITRSSS